MANPTIADRARNFAALTRQQMHPLPAQAGAAGGVNSFTLPRSGLLSKIQIMLEGTITAVHASETSYTPKAHSPFSLIKNITLKANNGFNLYQIDGTSAYFMQLLNSNASAITIVQDTATNTAASRKINKIGTTSSSSTGTANKFQCMVDLPVALNDRDPVGLLLLQNPDTVVTLEVTLGTAADICETSNYTFTLSAMTITPLVWTYTVPAVADAAIDLSIIKLVGQQEETISGAGVVQSRIPTGTIFRKLLCYITDSSGGEADADLSGNIELKFNQADTPYSVPFSHLAAQNTEHYGTTLPNGLFVFDFTAYQGLANYAGSRDYIDTEKLTEFWVKFTAAAAGKVRYVYEQLTRLA